VYQDEDLQTRTGKERGRERKAAIVKEECIVCYSLMKNNKKKHPHWQEEITCFFTSIGWSLPFLGRLSTNRVGRRRRRRKKKASK
jgi:hypothetical protein